MANTTHMHAGKGYDPPRRDSSWRTKQSNIDGEARIVLSLKALLDRVCQRGVHGDVMIKVTIDDGIIVGDVEVTDHRRERRELP